METTNILNVTALEPRLKHPRIFEEFDGLTHGSAFIINNDHDPKPLYYQMLAERGQTFIWEYLENGPEVWQVKITKHLSGQDEETIGEMVTKDYRRAQVFKNFGIDFCCGGKKTIAEVCNTKGINPEQVNEALGAISDDAPASENDYLKWDMGFLADFIVNTHHQYIKDDTGFITELAVKVAKVHGDQHPELIQVAEIFTGLADDLMLHIRKEERVLFPFIKELANVQKNGGQIPENSLGEVSAPIQMMEAEHEQAGEALAHIRELTGNFRLPEGACASYTILFKKLAEYEDDLHRHVHLENNVLFPKAILAEKNYRLLVS
jgi:regulator of cell morphogenesis and NO signaling